MVRIFYLIGQFNPWDDDSLGWSGLLGPNDGLHVLGWKGGFGLRAGGGEGRLLQQENTIDSIPFFCYIM